MATHCETTQHQVIRDDDDTAIDNESAALLEFAGSMIAGGLYSEGTREAAALGNVVSAGTSSMNTYVDRENTLNAAELGKSEITIGDTKNNNSSQTYNNVNRESKERRKKTGRSSVILETSLGEIEIELLHDVAPKTCDNFIRLASEGFYDGVTFHRVIPNFMIQSGCPYSKKGANGVPGTGSSGLFVEAEFNKTKHVPGVVSMARDKDPDGASSQFFICVGTYPHLDGVYTAFGKVVRGFNVVGKISKVKTDNKDKPIEDIVVKKATVKL